MKRGLIWLIVFVVVLVVMNGFVLFNYFSVTGDVVSDDVDVEDVDAREVLDVPSEIMISTRIGVRTTETFDVTNTGEETLEVQCALPSFQAYVDASGCFTYDANGQFVGIRSVTIPPGATQVFTVWVEPQNNLRIRRSGEEILVTITEGTYSGVVTLTVSEGGNDDIDQIEIPVRILVDR